MRLTQTLAPRFNRWQRQGKRFLRAWGKELLGSVPARWRERILPKPKLQYYPWPLPAHPSEAVPGARHILLLPAEVVLIRPVTLPMAAFRALDDVLQFELDRYTPFNAEQLFYAVREERSDGVQVSLTLVVILRERLEAILAHCQAHNVPVDGVDVLGPDKRRLGIDIGPPERRQRRDTRAARLTWALGIGCGVLALACMGAWQHNRAQALADLQAQVQAQRGEVAQVQQLRQALAAQEGAAQYLAQRRRAQPTRAVLLSQLTGCLPADTWLQTLQVAADGQVDMAGLSARASGLISQLKQCPSLVDAQFQGIIQPDQASGGERFYLRAHARGEVADATPANRP